MARKKRTKKSRLTTPLTTRYYHCKKAELARFATDRGLDVLNTSTDPRKGPLQDDYVRALKQADNYMSFRFLDLPPEMRNMVYKELVVLQESWYCHPQILATSKHVNKEASSILYGDNLIEIKIYEDGVNTHGKRSGLYVPGRVAGYGDFRKLEWPDLLHRVQHLRIAVVELPRAVAEPAPHLKPLANPPLSNLEIMYGEWVGAIGRGLLSHGFNHGQKWEKELLKYVDSVRVRHERADPRGLDLALRTRLEEILRAGVHLRQRQAMETLQ
ncbi:hypothetical protein LTR85_011854 [Meristemomyces frigidus]|nr:hypothetical protein LTR85_011854 [Meristemomyces frigidus]